MMNKGYGWDPFFNTVHHTVWDQLNTQLKAAGEKVINDIQNAIEPGMPLIFQALKSVQPNNIKVVILGQDPTPQPGKATGLAFSVENPRFVPAVLSMLLEVAFEGFPINLDKAGVLEWAKQGVLLLNTAFTCPHKSKEKKSEKKDKKENNDGHFKIWKDFTVRLISYITQVAQPSVWLLWGGEAHKFKDIIEGEKIPVNQNGQVLQRAKHLVIKGGHPSPVGTAKHGDSFFGGGYFICANQFLQSNGRSKIDWSLSSSNSLKQCPQFEEEKRQLQQLNQQQLLPPNIYQQQLQELKNKQQQQFQLQQPHQQELHRLQQELGQLHQKVLQLKLKLLLERKRKARKQQKIPYLQQRQQQLPPHQHY